MSRALISDQISTTKELQYKSINCVLNCQMCLAYMIIIYLLACSFSVVNLLCLLTCCKNKKNT